MPTRWSEWAVPGLTTKVVKTESGLSYRLLLSLPEGSPPPVGWPALWVLDSDQHGLALMDAARRLARRPEVTGVEPMAVVGVAPEGGGERQAMRYRDFTPGPGPHEIDRRYETGGAIAFLEALSEPLMSEVEMTGRVSRRAPRLWGHSLGGFFALWAAGARPGLFSRVAAISPSIWWDERALEPLHGAPTPIFLAVGEREFDDRPGGRRMIGRARRLHERLAEAGTPARFRLFDDEDHSSIVTSSAAAALRSLSEPAGDGRL